MNTVILLGRLGRDPEIKYAQSGTAIAHFSLATDEFYERNGQKGKETSWHRIVVFGKLAQQCALLRKGKRVLVEGKLNYRNYTDARGEYRYVTEIIARRVVFVDYMRAEALAYDSEPTEAGEIQSDQSDGNADSSEGEDVPF